MVESINQPTTEELVRWHRVFAPRFFNHTWELMDKDDRDDDDNDELLASAFAQRAHWYQVGDGRQRAIADWQVARAAVLTGYPELARRYGERALREPDELDPFVLGFAHESLARAAASVDDLDSFEAHMLAARELALQIEDEEDRRVLVADLDEMTSRDV